MRIIATLLLLFVSAAAFAQTPGYSTDQQEADIAINELNARTFYLQTGMTPGDWAKLSKSEKEQFAVRFQCKQDLDQIDEQLELEHAGHVGFYNWQSLRQVEQRDCGNMAYRIGESPDDTYPAAYAKQHADMMKATHGMPPPHYPMSAIREHREGVVVVKFLVGPKGSAEDASVYQSSGFHDLDAAAVASASQWHFNKDFGKWKTAPVTFSLSH